MTFTLQGAYLTEKLSKVSSKQKIIKHLRNKNYRFVAKAKKMKTLMGVHPTHSETNWKLDDLFKNAKSCQKIKPVVLTTNRFRDFGRLSKFKYIR